jgi:O-antigen ligase
LHVAAGPINVYPFDLLLLAAFLLLLRETISTRDERLPSANRTVVLLTFAYCAYQVAVILPMAVIFHDLGVVSVVRDLEWRISLILVPFMYLVVLRYLSPRHAIAAVNAAAIVLALYIVYKYVSIGPVFDGTTRLRELGGAATLLFGFLILTALFLMRPGILSYAAAVLGLIGIALTNHRSGYLALIVVSLPLLFHFRRLSSRGVVVLLVVMSCAGLLFVAAPTIRDSVYYSLRTMLNPSADRNARDRVDRSRLGWDYFVANPLGDHVWNQRFYLVYLRDPFEPHNFVIQILNQQGIVGFAFFAAIIGATVRVGWRNRAADRTSAVMLSTRSSSINGTSCCSPCPSV